MLRNGVTSASSYGLRWLLTATWLTYTVVLVWTTHAPSVPQPRIPIGSIPPDKVLHFAAYAVLGMLTVLAAQAWRRIGPRTLLVVFAALALFALADEGTQPAFGRVTEFQDWIADVAGVAAALAAWLAAAWIGSRLKASTG